jgi:hypothetical protein
MTCLRKLMVVGIALIPLIILVGACERTITSTENVSAPANCFECHSDVNTALVAAEQQWSNSVHASGSNIDRSSSSCSGCHTSEGFVSRISGGGTMTVNNPTVIHCFTCHAPHTRGNLSLRVTEPQTLANGESFDLGSGNLCTACHQSRRDVNTYVALDTVELSEHWGPHHGPQGDMVIASNGYEYADYDYERSLAHRGSTADGCLDCHMKTTLNNVLGGHAFNMTFTTLEEGGVEETENTNGCNVEACHDGDVDDFDHEDTQTEVHALLDELELLLFNARLIDAEGHPLDDRFVASRSEPGDSAGAVWNYLLVEEGRSFGIHNPKYIKSLLESAIEFMTPSGPSVASSGE